MPDPERTKAMEEACREAIDAVGGLSGMLWVQFPDRENQFAVVADKSKVARRELVKALREGAEHVAKMNPGEGR